MKTCEQYWRTAKEIHGEGGVVPDPSRDYVVWDTWRQIDNLLRGLAEYRK